MITLAAPIGVNTAKFKATMHERFDNWKGNVQICHAPRRASDGSKYIKFAVNPLRGFELPADAEQVAQEVLTEVSA